MALALGALVHGDEGMLLADVVDVVSHGLPNRHVGGAAPDA